MVGSLAVALLLNSAVVAYALYSLRELREHLRWTLLVTVPARAAAAEASAAAPGPGAAPALQVDFYSDFACPYCRASAAAVDSVRRRFGGEVRWRYWHVPRSPAIDPLAMQAAAVGVCTERDGGPWELYRLLGGAEAWSETALQRAVERLAVPADSLRRCTESDRVRSRIWSDLFVAARRGITATPTIEVNGTRVEGTLAVEPLAQLVEAELARARSSQARAQDSVFASPRT